MPTIREVAKAADVSPMTVSFVLNDKPGQVSEETRVRVLRAVRELGYRPRVAARPSREASVRTLGIASGVHTASLVQSGYYNAVCQGIFQATDRLNLNVVIFHRSLFHEDTHRSIRTYFDGRCDGLIVIAPLIGAPLLPAFVERGVPFIVIGDTGDDPRTPFVDVDNVREAEAVVRRLVGMGHQRIGFIGGVDFVRSSVQRREGWERAHHAENIPFDPDLAVVGIGDSSHENLVHGMGRLMSRPKETRPTVIWAWNDSTAIRTMAILRDLGFSVPGDISVVGFDDDAPAFLCNPPLTTVRQPTAQIGSQAVEALVARIRDDSPAPPVQRFVPTQWIERESLLPIPAVKQE